MSEAQFQKIGILGTGTIGSSWAAFYASRGMKVKIFDISPDNLDIGLKKARQYLNDLLEFDLADKKIIEEAFKKAEVQYNE